MKNCDAIQDRLAEAGAAAVESDRDVRQHIESCADCREVLANLSALDSALQDLPPHDAPDSLVADTLHTVRRAPRGDQGSLRSIVNRRTLAGALAASVVVAASIGLLQTYGPFYAQRSPFADSSDDSPAGIIDRLSKTEVAENVVESAEREVDQPVASATGPAVTRGEASEVGGFARDEFGDDSQSVAQSPQRKRDLAQLRPEEGERRPVVDHRLANKPREPEDEERFRKESELIALLDSNLRSGERSARESQSRLKQESKKKESTAFERQLTPESQIAGAKTKDAGSYNERLGSESGHLEGFAMRSNDPVPEAEPEPAPKPPAAPPPSYRGDEVTVMGNVGEAAPAPRDLSSDQKNRIVGGQDKEELHAQTEADVFEAGKGGASTRALEEAPAAVTAPFGYDEKGQRRIAGAGVANGSRLVAQRFLQELGAQEGLTFQPATGYWSNSYIPGDPAMRLLQARLQAWNRATLGQDLRLEQDVRPVSQPFDAPQDAALAVYLDADTRAIEGPTRLRLQVGLKGAERQGGHRPAMNVGLVVDLRSLGDGTSGSRVRALVTALEQIRQPGDRFSLTVAGPDGGLLVPPEQFRHGPLRVAMERLFGDAQETETATVDLIDAVTLASRSVREGDDPNTVLGASLVLVATGSSLADDLADLERIAHQNAVTGVPMSVVSLGDKAELDHIDRLVAAGQGNRRILAAADQADSLIDRELHSASRAVSRAVRLRIRLAPGVKLIDVLGSQRLDEPQAQRVREAEQSIDQRLARNLGIQADRGEDEEGIQIVIPSFYAGDAHVVLLDVVAEKPGPIADVTARYKDVVYLRNGVARAGLTIETGATVQGPLERNVLKNRVAWELARQTRLVGQYLREGYTQEAAAIMAELRDLIHGLRLEVPGWASDNDLAADETMLGEYLAVLTSPAANDAVQRRYLADSLHYAAYRKLQTAAR